MLGFNRKYESKIENIEMKTMTEKREITNTEQKRMWTCPFDK